MNEELFLNPKGAMELRKLAAVMPRLVESINKDTMELLQVYLSLEGSLGVHRDSFRSLLLYIKASQEESVEAVNALPKKLEETAQKIEQYLASHSGEEETSPPSMRKVLRP